MATSYLAILEAFQQAEHRCQCTDPAHSGTETGRCDRLLLWEDRGCDREFGWDVAERNGQLLVLCCVCHEALTARDAGARHDHLPPPPKPPAS